MTYRVRNIVLAVALASLAALLTMFYVANYKRSVQDEEKNVPVFVAKADIPAGTSGAQAVSRGLLVETQMAKRNVVPGAISSENQITDLVATQTIFAKEQVSTRRFRPVEEAGIRSELKGNVRAFQMAGDANQLLSGTLKRGDRVDMVANFKFKIAGDEREHTATRVVLRDLLVLKAPAVGDTTNKLASASGNGFSAQVAVTDAQAQKLFFAMKNGEWHLDLRAPVEAADSPESMETMDTVLCDGMSRNKFAWVCFGRVGR